MKFVELEVWIGKLNKNFLEKFQGAMKFVNYVAASIMGGRITKNPL